MYNYSCCDLKLSLKIAKLSGWCKLSKTLKVRQVGKNTDYFKAFEVNASQNDLMNHLLYFLKGIRINESDLKKKTALDTAKFLLTNEMQNRFTDLTFSNEVTIESFSRSEFRELLTNYRIDNKESGSKLTGELELIFRYYKGLIAFWLFRACLACKLSGYDVWPTIDLPINSEVTLLGALSGVSDVEALAVFCSTKIGLVTAKQNHSFSERFKNLIDDLSDEYDKKAIRSHTFYRSSASYILREHIIRSGWDGSTLDISELYETKRKLDLKSGSGLFSFGPLLPLLVEYNLISNNNKIINSKEFKEFIESNLNQDPNYLAAMRSRTYNRVNLEFGGTLSNIKYVIGQTYETEKLGQLVFRGSFEDQLYFHTKTPNYVSKSYSNVFKDLNLFLKDFERSKKKVSSPSTLRGFRGQLAVLKMYLQEYLYEFSINNNYPFLNCGGKNFLKTELSIAFNDSELIKSRFEDILGGTIRPIQYRDWLIFMDFSESSLEPKLRVCKEFFAFCATTAKQLGKNYTSPIPEGFTKGVSARLTETTKEIFGYSEWVIWSELTENIFDSLNKLLSRKVIKTDRDLTLQEINEAIESAKPITTIEKNYGISIILTGEMIEYATSQYFYQSENSLNPYTPLNSISFMSCLAAIVTMNNCGLRSHSASNLPYENLDLGTIGIYTKINVIADKVNVNGFESLLPTELVKKILDFRSKAIKISRSAFMNDRELKKASDVSEIFPGLFGSYKNCNEKNITNVGDFCFYLFNQVVYEANRQLKAKILSPIPVNYMPKGFIRGTSLDFKKATIKENAYVGFYDVLNMLPIEELENSLNPLLIVSQRPDRTIHSLRASFVSNLAYNNVSSEIIKYFTGQEAPTVTHYSKATPENLKILERDGHLGLINRILKGEAPRHPEKVVDEINAKIQQGVLNSGGVVCSAINVVTKRDINSIYSSGYNHLAIHSTHICPYNDQCPSDVSIELNFEKNCAVCPVSVSFLSDVPAIKAKIKFHLEESQDFQEKLKSSTSNIHRTELKGAWERHSKEASMWMARFVQLTSNKAAVVGGELIVNGKDSLLQFKCEDSEVLSNLFEILETKDMYAYQSNRLKSKARLIGMKLARKYKDLDPNLFDTDPIESVSQTIRKLLRLNKIELIEVIEHLSLVENKQQLDNKNQALLEVVNG